MDPSPKCKKGSDDSDTHYHEPNPKAMTTKGQKMLGERLTVALKFNVPEILVFGYNLKRMDSIKKSLHFKKSFGNTWAQLCQAEV
jgi:hypothetical protein